MAYKYHWHMENTWLFRGIRGAFASTFAITVFGNTQPTANDVVNNWSTTYYNQSLAHFTGAAWQFSNPSTRGSVLSLNSPTALLTTGLNTGTAAWGILWISNVTAANAVITTLPNTSFLVVPAGDVMSNAVIRLSSNSVVTSGNVELDDLNMTIKVIN